jgi:hypothetical protein
MMSRLSRSKGKASLRGFFALKGILLALIFSIVASQFAAAMEIEAHPVAAMHEITVAQMPAGQGQVHDEKSCLLCHVACHCHSALLASDASSLTKPEPRRLVFSFEATVLKSVLPSAATEPPRAG